MKVELVRIGNSAGIRIPKALIAADRPAPHGRREAFMASARPTRDPLLLEAALPNELNSEEWT